MSTYEIATTKYINAKGIKFAYRLFGATTGIPLFIHVHFRGTMDHWDPSLLNPLAEQRPILLVDNSGIGRSEGTIPPTYAGWADNIAAVVEALGIKQIDAMGFSMGGFTAQMLKLNHPKLVRRLILAGTGPSAGDGIQTSEEGIIEILVGGVTEEEVADGLKQTLFPLTEEGQKAAKSYWYRVLAAHPPPERSLFLGQEGAMQQLGAAERFLDRQYSQESSFDRLEEIEGSVLVINGDHDVVIPTVNSIILWQKLVNARVDLHIFPKSGHGFLYQHAASVAALINRFLNEESE